MSLAQRRILLGITGGIAAYKSADLARRLKEAGADVQVVMTPAATTFITPLTLQAVSGRPVRVDLLDPAAEAGMGHIELARWAELILIAPASADFLARLAHGFADDLLATLCLASDRPLAVAPAMNRLMWAHPATQVNVATLAARGVRVWGPAAGEQACGEVGAGRMLEALELRAHAAAFFADGVLAGRRVLISAGPTREPLDPVRFITNRSTGKQGFAIAAAAAAAGAEVTLVAGPVTLPTPAGVARIDVESAAEMHAAVLARAPAHDIFVATAAVADYRAAAPAERKMKKSAETLTLDLVRNPDILADVAALTSGRPFCVGFAAETHDVLAYAEDKRRRKRLDLICANHVGAGKGFEADDNALHVLWEGGSRELPLADKRELARALVALIAERYAAA
ncbi:phosphopantothenate-cysteine ligase /phosphopantothenoylcysteine decarboxylase [Plasticicumulans lactativorans]|uniref:Coenzyme A biosynthesis bifunctional protein CoaBC n=1 Tax=Plasticicumulans lactativorans TaxID=1133106 RepID=A0A4R2LPH4_9GAMM|nr:bifunctional phosphopantothenoylcysteine decarboxylase/phosphopantothenate--cysteine ligase CoaBC [Plasticicumulans lactativorans]TCO81415.1 phosphopantothenate-cysteine ligase /phosphopantothenoylcysteine decarboxylase [Plasticicumulans lactativorans]